MEIFGLNTIPSLSIIWHIQLFSLNESLGKVCVSNANENCYFLFHASKHPHVLETLNGWTRSLSLGMGRRRSQVPTGLVKNFCPSYLEISNYMWSSKCQTQVQTQNKHPRNAGELLNAPRLFMNLWEDRKFTNNTAQFPKSIKFPKLQDNVKCKSFKIFSL